MTLLEKAGLGAVAFFLLLAALNWCIVIRNCLKRDRYVSMIPLVGGLAGALGCLLVSFLRPFAWAPLLADPGTLMLFFALPWMLREVWQTSSFVRSLRPSPWRKMFTESMQPPRAHACP